MQYAIQGKLVEQSPEEGTGEELYQQIQAEKRPLIQEKKIKKEKHTYPKLYSEITPLINKRNIMESIHRNTYD